MKTILILLCVLTLASCGSRSDERAKLRNTTVDSVTLAKTKSIYGDKLTPILTSEQIASCVSAKIGRYVPSTKGEIVTNLDGTMYYSNTVLLRASTNDTLVYTYDPYEENWNYLTFK